MSTQANSNHPLTRFGYRQPPHWLWRLSRRGFAIVGAIGDIWLIASGRLNLHRAWQEGYDDHSRETFCADNEKSK